jgi:hypothetical protein
VKLGPQKAARSDPWPGEDFGRRSWVGVIFWALARITV